MPPYLDKKHQYYADELAIAIQAWMAVYGGGNVQAQKGNKGQIETWLNKNYQTPRKGEAANYTDTLSKECKKRIITVVNPNKSGGAPKS